MQTTRADGIGATLAVAKKVVGLTWKANRCACIISANCNSCIQIRQPHVVKKFYEINREAAVIPPHSKALQSSRHVGMYSLLTARQICIIINNHGIVAQSIIYLKPFNHVTTCLSEGFLSYHLQFEDYYCKRYCLALSNKTLRDIGRIFLSAPILTSVVFERMIFNEIVCVFLLWQWQIVASVFARFGSLLFPLGNKTVL
jgi:hypothetical protein